MGKFDNILQKIETGGVKHKRNIFSAIALKSHPLILYGAGGNCEFAMFTCSLMNAPVQCVCDSKATGYYCYKNQSYSIITPQELFEQYKDSYVLITPWRYEEEIYEKLLEKGFPEENIFFLRYPHRISLEEFQNKYLTGFRWAYEYFEDDDSKKRIIDRVKLLLTGVPCPADSLYKDGYFGYPKVTLCENEVYVDGGAYIGDTAEEFISYAEKEEKKYKHIYSFEPDEKNCNLAKKNLRHYEKVSVVPAGLWSKTTTLEFYSESGGDCIGSHLTEVKNGQTVSVPVVSLDEFFSDKPQDEWPTIIKMDIEGSEKEALVGATKIIRAKKPKLMICAYHKPEDIYELPQTILSIRPDYKLEFWQIGESFWDMILYAV